MSRKLVIVESPAKAKTIGRYLGKDYHITASVGHIRDLPEKKTGVNVKKQYAPSYVIKDGKEKVVAELKKEASQADTIYLATDPDREGEAIAWHISEVLGLPEGQACRISFNEITEPAVRAAVASPRPIGMDLVHAQQARRILDRLVGYELSPVLWRKVRKGLSAGRVQSVATRMVVDRENEILGFKKEEYWVLTAVLAKKAAKRTFKARYFGELPDAPKKTGKADGGPRKVKVEDKETAERILADVEKSAFSVLSIKKGTKKPSPQPPFTTSTLQQEASRRLGFPSKKTMSVAQQLYEGVELAGQGTMALVTYIRIDSVRVSEEAVAEARRLIGSTYGPKYVPSSPRRYANRNTSQDAHEAIRPAHFDLSPESVRASLSNDQFRLYRLVWERFLASQMPPAEFDVVTLDVAAGRQVFRAVGETPRFDGFLAAFGEKDVEKDEESDEDDGKERIPELVEGEPLDLSGILKEQKFTQPPARYTEATLIKALEEEGIGRPSTYAPTLSTILDRKYIEKDKKFLLPTELGTKVTNYLLKNFEDIVDVKFTARMEGTLDTVEQGERGWVAVLDDFYPGFHKLVEKAKDGDGDKMPPVVVGKCPDCEDGQLQEKEGRFGKFIGCSNYPKCKHTEKILKSVTGPDGTTTTEPDVSKGVPTGEKCPECGEGDLILKDGSYGKFIACSRYPTCKYKKNVDQTVRGSCPKCGSGLVVRISKKFRGKRFYVCDKKGSDPACDFISWDLPMEGRTCETCGSYMVWRSFNGKGGFPKCGNRECPTNQKREKGSARAEKAVSAEASPAADA